MNKHSAAFVVSSPSRNGYSFCATVMAICIALLVCHVALVDALTPVRDMGSILAPTQSAAISAGSPRPKGVGAAVLLNVDEETDHRKLAQGGMSATKPGAKTARSDSDSELSDDEGAASKSGEPATKQARVETAQLGLRSRVSAGDCTGGDCALQNSAADGAGSPVRSFWVRDLTVKFEDRIPLPATFHEKLNRIVRPSAKNYVLAQLAAVYDVASGDKFVPLPIVSDKCFVSGLEDAELSYNEVQPDGQEVLRKQMCLGGNSASSSRDRYREVLGEVVGAGRKVSAQSHYHSEQALLAYLYNDAFECQSSGLTDQKCVFGRALDVSKLCNLRALVLDLISDTRTVCGNCNDGLSQARFLDGYKKAVKAACPSSPSLQLVIRTSAREVFQGNGYISCRILEEGPKAVDDILGSVILHKLPLTVGPKGYNIMSEDCLKLNLDQLKVAGELKKAQAASAAAEATGKKSAEAAAAAVLQSE